MHKYINKYRVLQEINLETKKPTTNNSDTFLICKNNIQIFRYDKDNLSIYFPTTNSRLKYEPLLKKFKIELLSDGDFESTFLFKEINFLEVAEIVKPQTKGKSIDPKSKQTVNKLLKFYGK